MKTASQINTNPFGRKKLILKFSYYLQPSALVFFAGSAYVLTKNISDLSLKEVSGSIFDYLY